MGSTSKEQGLMVETGWERRFEAFATELIERSRIPGAAVGVAHEGKVVYERGFGHRDAARSLPVTPDTRFGIGSVTKSFPCLAIVQLEEAGVLSVTDPVVRWLPEFKLPARNDAALTGEITIHHFMTHSSGLPPEPALLHARARSVCADPDFGRMHPKPLGIPEEICQLERIATYEELMALMARQEFATLGPPGRVLSYSNEGYVLLAAIVERASGRSFAAYLQEHMLDPLGMERTGLYTSETPPLEPEVIPFAVDTRGGTPEVFPSPAWWDQGEMFGNGGLKSTVRDLLRYLEVYRAGGVSHGSRVLSMAGVEKMIAPHMPIPTGGSYGYGLRVGVAPGGARLAEHGGGNKGVAAQVVVVPEQGVTAVALTNLSDAPASQLAFGAINTFWGEAPETPWTSYPEHEIDRGQLSRFVGEYRGRPGTVVRVSEGDGGLSVEIGGQSRRARPYGDRDFLIEELNQAISFLEDEHDDIWALHTGLVTMARAE